MKMMNTIRFPRINSNILVLTSFILICVMMLIAIHSALAWHCAEEGATMKTANDAVDLAEGLHELAKIALEKAQAAGIEWAINAAEKAVKWTAQGYVNAVLN